MRRALYHYSPTARLARRALTKGFLGGSRAWMVIGIALWGPQFLRKTFGRSAQFLSLEKLQPGQAVRIEAISAISRSERRAARRAR